MQRERGGEDERAIGYTRPDIHDHAANDYWERAVACHEVEIVHKAAGLALRPELQQGPPAQLEAPTRPDVTNLGDLSASYLPQGTGTCLVIECDYCGVVSENSWRLLLNAHRSYVSHVMAVTAPTRINVCLRGKNALRTFAIHGRRRLGPVRHSQDGGGKHSARAGEI